MTYAVVDLRPSSCLRCRTAISSHLPSLLLGVGPSSLALLPSVSSAPLPFLAVIRSSSSSSSFFFPLTPLLTLLLSPKTRPSFRPTSYRTLIVSRLVQSSPVSVALHAPAIHCTAQRVTASLEAQAGSTGSPPDIYICSSHHRPVPKANNRRSITSLAGPRRPTCAKTRLRAFVERGCADGLCAVRVSAGARERARTLFAGVVPLVPQHEGDEGDGDITSYYLRG